MVNAHPPSHPSPTTSHHHLMLLSPHSGIFSPSFVDSVWKGRTLLIPIAVKSGEMKRIRVEVSFRTLGNGLLGAIHCLLKVNGSDQRSVKCWKYCCQGKRQLDLLLQLLERFSGMPFRGGKRALAGKGHGYRQSITK